MTNLKQLPQSWNERMIQQGWMKQPCQPGVWYCRKTRATLPATVAETYKLMNLTPDEAVIAKSIMEENR